MSQSARGVALAALRQWRRSERLADEVIGLTLDQSELSGSDRAFATDLFYGVLRNRTVLDFWIGRLRDGKLDLELRELLQLGLYQLLLAKTAPHAAVNETVALAGPKHRSIANAILRNASRNEADLVSRGEAQPLFIRTSHPEFLVERWNRNFGADITAELCRWNNQPPPTYGRINRLKISVEAFLANSPAAQLAAGTENFVRFAVFPREQLERGECYLQDPSTRLACELLNASPNERILDACAAPGGKTVYLAELMRNQGVIIACDRNAERLRLIKENAARLGASIIRPVRQDWLGDSVPPSINETAPFDSILVDAPCTNTGVMRRRVDVRWRLRPDEFERMATTQVAIVSAVIPLLKTGGALVYSTCSLEPEENELVVQRLCQSHSNLKVEEVRASLPWQDGFDGAYAIRLRKG